MENKEADIKYKRAAKKVQEIKGFYTHLLVFSTIMPFIIFINLKFVPEFHWFWFSLIGWGCGLFIHWFNTFGVGLLGFGKDWEERKIKEIMQKNT